ncbi:MAG: orotidine-5'-phosphate decarboxylase [Planctomycetes bacterium]|nr:orotidine-5'-phosphate decarboxylase [Planctomycetota bacterium]
MSTYADRLDDAVSRCGNAALVGLDPHLDALPEEFAVARDAGAARAVRAQAMGDFLCEIVDVAAGRVPAVKPQSAFFEVFGADGMAQWERVVARARAAGLLVIGDVKRGDIDSTAKAYAQAFLQESPRCDAITINPYLGADAVRPFLDACARLGAGVYVLVRTSNKHSGLFQDHGSPPLHEKVADEVARWGSGLLGTCGLSSVGAVVGATHPEELARLRRRMPVTPFLIPGYGAQGGSAKDVGAGFLPGGRGALVNSSRGILYAYRQPAYAGMHWKDAASKALAAMQAEIAGCSR